MYFRVQHTTTYTYSEEIHLQPHIFRMRPRNSAQLHMSRYSLQIHPEPLSLVETLDAEGNLVHLAWFSQPTRKLVAVSSFEARNLCKNPFDFILTSHRAFKLPLTYTVQADILAPYRTPKRQTGPVARLAQKLKEDAVGQTMPFLTETLRHFSSYQKVIRNQGAPMLPEDVLAEKSGACRDLTMLFIELCRLQGLAARFVSGYWQGSRPSEKRYLHAWAEVYLPGAGWRGMDPSMGLAVADGHVPIAAARDPHSAAPIEGNFVGNKASAEMDWSIKIDVKPG